MTEPELHRRQLLVALASGAVAICCPRLAFAQDESLGASLESGPATGLSAHPARWWKSAGELRIECELCPNKCRVADRERGTCGVRENRDGKYYTLVYGRPCAMHIDPVEKKPFFHVLPGTTAVSLAAPGCNIQCKFCQNWEISQVRPEQVQTYAKSPSPSWKRRAASVPRLSRARTVSPLFGRNMSLILPLRPRKPGCAR